jgi:hypothetical protein
MTVRKSSGESHRWSLFKGRALQASKNVRHFTLDNLTSSNKFGTA